MRRRADGEDWGSIEDGFGSVWRRCKADCGINVVRPGKAQCDCDFDCECGGRIKYHTDGGPKHPNTSGYWCEKCGPNGDGA